MKYIMTIAALISISNRLHIRHQLFYVLPASRTIPNINSLFSLGMPNQESTRLQF